MSVNIPEGNYQGQPTSYEFGVDGKGAAVVRITMKVADGPHAGQTAQFKNGFGEKAVKYTKRALIALGWSGKDINTAKDEIMTSPRTVPMGIVIAEYEGRSWSSVRSIGAAGDPLKAADNSTLKDVNSWLAEAGDVGGAQDKVPF